MSRKTASALLVIGLLLVMVGVPAAAQDDTTTTSSTTTIPPSAPPRIEITDVNLDRYPRVTMTVDLRNIPDLDPSRVAISENGTPIEDLEVNTLEQSFQRIGIVLAIDTSGSMSTNDAIEAAKTAALAFIAQKRPQDWMALITFDDEVQVLSGFTNDGSALSSRVETIEASGGTAFYDAIIKAADLYRDIANEERNLIILTDGADSVYAADEREDAKQSALDAVQEVGVRVFGVALEGDDFSPDDVEEFALATEGLFRTTPDPEQLEALYGDIRRELNNKLVLQFTASEQQTTDVDFQVSYGALRGSATIAVPGYATTTLATTTTTGPLVFVPPSPVAPSESTLPASNTTLRIAATIAVFIALALFIVIVIRLDPDADQDSSVGARLRAYGRRGAARPTEAATGIMARIPFLRRFTERAEEAARRRGVLAALNSALEQGNIPLRPGEAMAAAVGLSIIAAVLIGVFTQSPTWGIGAFLGALILMAALVQVAGEREKRRFEAQLPDTLTLISTSLRAGYSLLQAVEAVAAEAPDPTSREFGRAIAESRLGRPVVQSLEGIAERMRSEDFEWAVMAIEIQREVGGNLAEVLQIVAETMLQRNRLRREVKALTAEGRISAIVLGAMPLGLFAFLFATNRQYLDPLITETVGRVAIGIGIGLLIVGAMWLRRITIIEV